MNNRVINVGETLPTVTVEIDGSPVRINKTDYDANPEKYTLVEGNVQAVENQSPDDSGAKSFPAGAQVGKKGKRFFVVDPDSGGELIVFDGIEHEAGYETEEAAWAAVMAAKTALAS